MICLNRSAYYLLVFLASITSIFTAHPIFAFDSLGECGNTQTKRYKSIMEVQGVFTAPSDTDLASPILDQWVVVEAIVTEDKTQSYQGFWLQQEDQSLKSSSASRGIFVYHKNANIQRGQRLRLLAQVSEYHGLTELKRVKALKVCAYNQPIPKATPLALPVESLVQLEALEGMRIVIKQGLFVSDLYGAGYGFGSNGQFAISTRLYFQPTELYSAREVQSRNIQLDDRALDYLLIDDGSATRFPAFIPFPNKHGFSANHPLRIGDGISHISAILHSYDEHYILVPESKEGALDLIIKTAARPVQPSISKDANFVVASMNLENYFNGTPKSFAHRDIGFPTSRGAKTYAGFLLQTEKLVSALSTIDADVIALMELENDGYGQHSAIADLTRALNTRFKPSLHYKYIIPTQKRLGRDDISVGILYRKKDIKPLGKPFVLDSNSSIKYLDSQGRSKALFNDGYHRPALLQKFSNKGQSFYIAANHFKSKGRPCKSEKEDSLQGHCNKERIKAAKALVSFIHRHTNDSDPVLILGDLNSYSQEDPLSVFAKAGYKNLNEVGTLYSGKEQFYSYSYQGYLGNLDHGLANSAMIPFVRSIDSWHINSVEDSLLDYQTESNGQNYPTIDHYAAPNAYRSSDHDPLVIGIEF